MNLTEKKSKKAALAKKEHNELDNLSSKVSSIESLKVYVGSLTLTPTALSFQSVDQRFT